MKEKNTPLSHEVVCMLDFETSNSKSEVSKSNSWKNLEIYLLQREPFFTMFYTINNYFEYLPIVYTASKTMTLGFSTVGTVSKK